MQRTVIFVSALLTALTLRAADGNATKPAKASTYRVKPGPFRIVVEFKGTFAAVKAHPVRVRPEAWGDLTLETDGVAHGALVKEGQELVKLKTKLLDRKIADSQLGLEVARLDLAVAQAEYAFATNTAAMDKAVAVRALARLQEDFNRYEKLTKAYSEESAEFSLASSKQSLAYAMEELKQLKKMYEADDITEETEEIILKRAEFSVKRSEHFLKRSQITHDATLKFSLPREHEDKTDALRRQELAALKVEGTHAEKLRKLKLGLSRQMTDLDRAGEALAKLERDRQLMTVTAPAAGLVYYGKFTDGVWGGQKLIKPKLRAQGKLAPGEVFLTVVEKRPLQVLGVVVEKNLLNVAIGQAGWATPTANPAHRVPVTVTAISRVPTAPGFHAVSLSANPGGRDYLLPGMGSTVKLTVLDEKAALTVPSNTLHQSAKGTPYVKVKGADGKITHTVVKLGSTHGGKTQITEGLKEGDEILLP